LAVTEQDYKAILARMRVDPLFRSLVVQIIRDNLDVVASPILREMELKIQEAVRDKKTYY